MNATTQIQPVRARTRQEGVALILTVLMLLLISALGLSALQHAGDENAVAASSRRKLTVVYAADAALNMASDQLLNSATAYPDQTPLNVVNLFQDESGLNISARSGTIDNPVAQPIMRVGTTVASGSQLNVNSSNTTSYGVYRIGIVATDAGGGRAQVQAQITVAEGGGSYQ